MRGAARRSAAPGCEEEALFVDLVRSADQLSRAFARLFKAHDLSGTQYNVLRILRGSPSGLLCGEVAERMITRDPDITRLLCRLETRGLISRSRQEKDRRMVLARITPAGLALLADLDAPVRELHRRQLGHLSHKQIGELSALLIAARGELS